MCSGEGNKKRAKKIGLVPIPQSLESLVNSTIPALDRPTIIHHSHPAI